jgi:ABC-type tungstate transport system substrate-binding protein
MDRREASAAERTKAVNAGVLLSSGFIAREALMAVLFAFIVLASEVMGRSVLLKITDSAWAGSLIFILLLYMLIKTPLNAMSGGGPCVKIK